MVHSNVQHSRRLLSALVGVVVCCAGFMTGCSNFVQSTEPPLNTVTDERLNDQAQMPFLINGLKGTFDNQYVTIMISADGLSDALYFDRHITGATYDTHGLIDKGNIEPDNADLVSLGLIRLLADTLVSRVYKTTFTDTSARKTALFNGFLYGAMEPYLWGQYFGQRTVSTGPVNTPGGVLNRSAFIPAAQMNALAMARLDSAAAYAPTPDSLRLINSLKARIQLYLGNYSQAATLAAAGLTAADNDWTATFRDVASNPWFYDAGPGRVQWGANPRFNDYVKADPLEAGRIPLVKAASSKTDTVYYTVNKYPLVSSSSSIMGWRENALIQAEAVLRGGDAVTALALVNSVRKDRGLADLTALTLDDLYTERDKELCFQGLRLIDERRFNKWHLGPDASMWFPITKAEINANPNIH